MRDAEKRVVLVREPVVDLRRDGVLPGLRKTGSEEIRGDQRIVGGGGQRRDAVEILCQGALPRHRNLVVCEGRARPVIGGGLRGQRIVQSEFSALGIHQAGEVALAHRRRRHLGGPGVGLPQLVAFV